MTMKSNRKSYPLTGFIQITGHGTSESGEPFVRIEIKGKRLLVYRFDETNHMHRIPFSRAHR
jgi:hypothetical protein